jgi:hypothetical protein
MLFEKLTKVERLLFDVMGIGLVLFYSYSAVLQPAATQYHRGVYVVIRCCTGRRDCWGGSGTTS